MKTILIVSTVLFTLYGCGPLPDEVLAELPKEVPEYIYGNSGISEIFSHMRYNLASVSGSLVKRRTNVFLIVRGTLKGESLIEKGDFILEVELIPNGIATMNSTLTGSSGSKIFVWRWLPNSFFTRNERFHEIGNKCRNILFQWWFSSMTFIRGG
jgi:hypothetical protein